MDWTSWHTWSSINYGSQDLSPLPSPQRVQAIKEGIICCLLLYFILSEMRTEDTDVLYKWMNVHHDGDATSKLRAKHMQARSPLYILNMADRPEKHHLEKAVKIQADWALKLRSSSTVSEDDRDTWAKDCFAGTPLCAVFLYDTNWEANITDLPITSCERGNTRLVACTGSLALVAVEWPVA